MLFVTIATIGCAHRREVYYGRDNGTGVSVRAPFVNVQVQGKPRGERSERATRDDDDDYDRKPKRVSRLPVDREDSDD